MEIKKTEKTIEVASAYTPELPSKAKKIGGKWNARSRRWVFDIRDEERVAELYQSVYGTWGNEDATLSDAVIVRMRANKDLYLNEGGFFVGGYMVVSLPRETYKRHGYGNEGDVTVCNILYHAGVTLGKGVTLVEGDFIPKGRPIFGIKTPEGTTIEIKDIPMTVIAANNDKLSKDWLVEIVSDLDNAALQAEKKRLLTRIAEIDTLLGQCKAA